MALRRFRIEVEGVDQEDVEEQLDIAFLKFADAAHTCADYAESYKIENFECTDESIKPINRNGQPLMYGRRVFKIIEREVANEI